MCMLCEAKKNDKIFKIKDRGYGSIFDLEEFKFQFCERCIEKYNIHQEWFNEIPDQNGNYKFENYIKNIQSMLKNGNLVNSIS